MIVPSHEATPFYSEVKWIWTHVSFKIANSLYHTSFSDLKVKTWRKSRKVEKTQDIKRGEKEDFSRTFLCVE
uniref:Uncharacterized protein n=1 Tax=Physcomitrium patens TaxID=3218 RepID=A0A2K1JEC8_PHYPA|nr:hypothetical protein PHYPA_020128 [Physcomitrium patens]